MRKWIYFVQLREILFIFNIVLLLTSCNVLLFNIIAPPCEIFIKLNGINIFV